MSNTTTNYQRDEKSKKNAKELLKRLASDYRAAKFTSLKMSTKITAGVEKEGITRSTRLRSKTHSTLTDTKSTWDPSLTNRDDLHRYQFFPSLNLSGEIIDISHYLSKAFSTTKHAFEVDCGQFGIAAFLLGLSHGRGDSVINAANVSVQGNVRILSGFDLYAKAQNDAQKAYAIDVLYDEFVVSIFDVCANNIMSYAYGLLAPQFGGNSMSQYNSVSNVRDAVRGTIKNMIPNFENLSSLLDNVSVVTYSRQAWLDEKGEEKAKVEVGGINVRDLYKIAYEKGVIDEVIVDLPPKLRPDDKVTKKVSYASIGLDSRDAYKLTKVYGAIYKAKSIDATPGKLAAGETGRRTKVLTQAQAQAKIVQMFAKYYDETTKTEGKIKIKTRNIAELMNRTKYIDITDANVAQVSSLTLTNLTTNTVLLYPNANMVQLPATKEEFAQNSDNALAMLLYSIGYANSKAEKNPPAHVKSVITAIYTLFGKEVPVNLSYNTVPAKGSVNTNAFGPSTHHAAQHHVPQHHVAQHVASPPQQQHQQSLFQGFATPSVAQGSEL